MRAKSGNGHNVDLDQFVADIKSVVNHGEELLKAGFTNVKARAISGAKTTNRAVRQHPYQSLGIVFGVGVFIGIMVTGLFRGEFDPETD